LSGIWISTVTVKFNLNWVCLPFLKKEKKNTLSVLQNDFSWLVGVKSGVMSTIPTSKNIFSIVKA
jgi:hypothetical protein